jgi:hypothetical protein
MLVILGEDRFNLIGKTLFLLLEHDFENRVDARNFIKGVNKSTNNK